jgi:hypothetical protein
MDVKVKSLFHFSKNSEKALESFIQGREDYSVQLRKSKKTKIMDTKRRSRMNSRF